MKLSFFSKQVLLFIAFACFSISISAQCPPGYSISILNSSGGVPNCPWYNNTALTALAKNATGTTIGANYTWEPGTIASQGINVSPSVTSVYTVSAYLPSAGCTVTETVAVAVMTVGTPVISYTTAPFNPTLTVSFSVTQSGVNGGTFSIVPFHSSVSIDPSTGVITASGYSGGTYTVSYRVASFSSGGGFCEEYVATTEVILRNIVCPISLPVHSYTLCPDDKVVFQPTVSYIPIEGAPPDPSAPAGGSLIWSPALPGSGLNCSSCQSPTLTFGGTATIYTVTVTYMGQVCGTTTVGVTAREYCQKEELFGCCFNNYGAAVWINDDNTYLNIYCNLINELGNTPGASPSLQKGEFENVNGTVRVLLDWVHHAKNDLYTIQQGTTSLFGADQKIKGNSNTHYNELWLNGNGIKSLWVNAYAHGDLDLTANLFDLQNFRFLMKNAASGIIRTSGYASTGVNGYFSRTLNTTATQPLQNYLYPMGASATATAPFRYRPLVFANNSAVSPDEVSVNFMNTAPSVTNDAAFVHANPTLTNVITNQAPNVLQINNAFYHKIEPTDAVNTPTSDLAIRSFYLPSDGLFQSLAEWKKDPLQTLDWWGGTPGASASNSLSSDPGTPGMVYAMANGTFNFNHKPFTLSRGGFYLNTSSFGNTGGGGSNFTLSAVPPISGPTPSGGGLNNPYGTGTNSGNYGSGGNTVFTPNPVAGEYVMTVGAANSCEVGGNIRFVIDQNGNIDPTTVKYGIMPNVYLGELSEAVYTIDAVNSGITFSATPRDLLKKCVNSVTITTTDNDYVLTSSENIEVNLPAVSNVNNTITYGQFKIYNKANVQVFASAGNMNSGHTSLTVSLTPDVYRFELSVTASTAPPTTEIIRGQLIVK